MQQPQMCQVAQVNEFVKKSNVERCEVVKRQFQDYDSSRWYIDTGSQKVFDNVVKMDDSDSVADGIGAKAEGLRLSC
ncbi:uncharacterized protein CCR75_008792 [Bremia lactucae]|uniref:Uncharacterized protein n=1 Tax=Bremia lactucae TaxID=4779 RepID=A0A976II76_BRELC|nr:hypothetical protein CCR75_006995 [Bremia lactucae]TDH72274.1 hypothetical protein CCR75_008792 [Bremia lactucae]